MHSVTQEDRCRTWYLVGTELDEIVMRSPNWPDASAVAQTLHAHMYIRREAVRAGAGGESEWLWFIYQRPQCHTHAPKVMKSLWSADVGPAHMLAIAMRTGS